MSLKAILIGLGIFSTALPALAVLQLNMPGNSLNAKDRGVEFKHPPVDPTPWACSAEGCDKESYGFSWDGVAPGYCSLTNIVPYGIPIVFVNEIPNGYLRTGSKPVLIRDSTNTNVISVMLAPLTGDKGKYVFARLYSSPTSLVVCKNTAGENVDVSSLTMQDMPLSPRLSGIDMRYSSRLALDMPEGEYRMQFTTTGASNAAVIEDIIPGVFRFVNYENSITIPPIAPPTLTRADNRVSATWSVPIGLIKGRIVTGTGDTVVVEDMATAVTGCNIRNNSTFTLNVNGQQIKPNAKGANMVGEQCSLYNITAQDIQTGENQVPINIQIYIG